MNVKELSFFVSGKYMKWVQGRKKGQTKIKVLCKYGLIRAINSIKYYS